MIVIVKNFDDSFPACHFIIVWYPILRDVDPAPVANVCSVYRSSVVRNLIGCDRGEGSRIGIGVPKPAGLTWVAVL